MRPDTSKERRNGWIVLGGAVAASLIALWIYGADNGRADQLEKAKADHAKMTGSESIATRIDRERKVNDILRQSINELKQQTGFQLAHFFTITDEDVRNSGGKHKSEIFADNQLSVVHDDISHRAEDLDLTSSDIGFDTKNMKMTDDETLINSIYLQITDRVAVICCSIPPGVGTDHIHSLKITHANDLTLPKPISPPGRPPLLREYPVQVHIEGPLAEVMYILTRFCDPKLTPDPDHPDLTHDPGMYPLVLQKATFHCDRSVVEEPNEPVDKQLDVTVDFAVAALQFIDEAKRGASPAAPGAAPGAPGAAGGPRF